MVERHEDDGNKHKVENQTQDYETFSTPKTVAEPKTKRGRKLKKLRINREKTESELEAAYLDHIQKLLPRDLAVIARPDYYHSAPKKHRRYNRGVQRAKNDLDLLSFLLESLQPHYRQKILLSNEFNRFFKTYLGIVENTSIRLTQQQKDQALVAAIQLLGNSLYVIKKNMPIEFHESLNDLGLPFARLVDSISIYARGRDKKFPEVRISENFIKRDDVFPDMTK